MPIHRLKVMAMVVGGDEVGEVDEEDEVVEVEDIQKEVQTLDPKDMIINATHLVMTRPSKN